MSHRDSEPEFFERLNGARAAANAGRLEEAEEAFVRLLAERRGEGGELERAACDSLFNVYFRTRRHVETLLLGRHLRMLCGDLEDDPDRTAYTVRILALTWLEAGSLELARELLEEMDAALRLPSHRPREQLEHLRDDAWMSLALRSGDLAQARERLDARNASLADRPPVLGELAFLRGTEAELLRREGSFERSLDVLEEAGRLVGELPWLRALFLVDRAETLHALGEAEAVSRAARDAASEMRSAEVLGALPQLVVDSCARLDACLDERPEAREAVDDVQELAAEAVLVRIGEVDRCLRQVPELVRPNPEDLQLLKRIRRRTLRWSKALGRRVGRRFVERLEAGDRLPLEPSAAGGFLRVCAWCDRAAGRGGEWLPIGEYLVPNDALQVTHGMCEDCVPSFRRSG